MKRLLLIVLLLLSGCKSENLSNYLFPISLGIDKVGNEYEIFLQIISNSNLSKIPNESSYDSSYEIIIVRSKGESLISAIKNLNKLSKDIFSFKHLRSLIISLNLLDKPETYLQLLDLNIVDGNVYLYSSEDINALFKAGKILENTSYRNKVNSPKSFNYYKPITLLEFYKRYLLSMQCYLPFLIPNEENSSYVKDSKESKNFITLVKGAYFIKENCCIYLENEKLIGNIYLVNNYLEIVENDYFLKIPKLKYHLRITNALNLEISLKNTSIYYYKDISKEKIIQKIKKDIETTYSNCYPLVDIYDFDFYKSYYHLNSLHYNLNIDLEIKSYQKLNSHY